MSRTRLAGEFGKVGTGTKADLRFCRLPVRPQGRSGPTDTGPLAEPSGQNTRNTVTTGLSSPAVHVSDRFTNSHRKAGSPRPTSYESHAVASQKQLEGTRITRKGDYNTKVLAPTFTMVAARGHWPYRLTITPNKTCSTNLYRSMKRRVGRSLKRTHCKRHLVPSGKQVAYQLSRTQGSLFSLKRVLRPLHKQDSTCSNRQHHSVVIHKQRRRHEVGPTLCSTKENLDRVHQESSNPQSPAHSRPANVVADKLSKLGQTIQTEWSLLQEVFQTICSQWYRPQIDLFATRFNNKLPSVCVTRTGSDGHSSGCTKSAMAGSGHVCLPTSSHLGQSGGEVTGLPMSENHSDCSGETQHALFFGSNGHVQSDSTESAQPVNTALQSDPSQKSDKSESPYMAPRATAIIEQGFSEAVAARIEVPQRGSTRSVHEPKWCITNQVDFRAPPVKSVADFPMYLFEDRKLQPSTIDGYRSAIADKLGILPVIISKDGNLTCLLDSFHRDRPKGRRGIPSWNLSLVLHQLTKAPFEPIQEASLKHLTFKTVYPLGPWVRQAQK